MSAPFTFESAKTRLAGLVTTKITVGDAIQEAMERIFEMGRYRGTTQEIPLATEAFIYDPALKETFLYFVRADYSAAIAFRNDKRGWSIVDHQSLYREGINEGDYKFVNMGDVDADIKYRCPTRNWEISEGPFFALMKKECPTFEDEDILPIATIGALKHAVQAVSYEYLNDEAAADASWARFNQAMTGDEFLSDGPVHRVGTPYGY